MPERQTRCVVTPRAVWTALLWITAIGFASPCGVRAQLNSPSPNELVVAERPARAGNPSPAEVAYRQLIDSALGEYGEGNYLEARALFYKAHGLFPNARTLRALGLTEFELRDYRECVRLLSEALSSNERPLSGPMRADTERLLARARDFFGSANLRISPADASAVASVLLDDRPVPRSSWNALSLNLGAHQLTVRAAGYEPFHQSFQVLNGHDQDVDINLTPLRETDASPPPLSGALRHDGPTRKPLYRNAWLWTGAGLLIGTVVVSVFLLRREPQDRFSEPITTPNTPPDGVIRIGLGGT